MKKEFSTKWSGSKQPRKQRKFIAKLPLHLSKKLLSVNLSKNLRKKYSRRNIAVRKGDTVKIMRGKYAKKQGKVAKVSRKLGKIYIENIQVTKLEGSKADVPMKASNLKIIELNTEDRKRNKMFNEGKKKESKKENKESKDVKKDVEVKKKTEEKK